jgi:hypothetical protein
MGPSEEYARPGSMRTDPTDNGGLFIGRRPGTGPIRYRGTPDPSVGMHRAFDRLFAASLLAFMMLVSLAFWGPIPAGCLWLGAQVQAQTESGSLGIVVSCLGVLAALLGGLVVLKRLDRFWILVRRAAGYDQRSGVIGSVFAIAAVIGVALFVAWFLLLAGQGSDLIGGRR